MNSSATAPLEVALAYHRAWTSKNMDDAMAQVSDDVVCHAPAGTLTGVAALRDFMGPYAQMLTASQLVMSSGDADGALLMYDTSNPVVESAPAAEAYTVADGKITTIRIIFDRLPFALARGDVVPRVS